jgi:hypothetical protein
MLQYAATLIHIFSTDCQLLFTFHQSSNNYRPCTALYLKSTVYLHMLAVLTFYKDILAVIILSFSSGL